MYLWSTETTWPQRNVHEKKIWIQSRLYPSNFRINKQLFQAIVQNTNMTLSHYENKRNWLNAAIRSSIIWKACSWNAHRLENLQRSKGRIRIELPNQMTRASRWEINEIWIRKQSCNFADLRLRNSVRRVTSRRNRSSGCISCGSRPTVTSRAIAGSLISWVIWLLIPPLILNS